MKKLFLLSVLFIRFGMLSAQTSDPLIVADNTIHMNSCEDTLITLQDIIKYTGIRDLNDPTADTDDYRLMRLTGSNMSEENVITGAIKYSDYDKIFVHKKGTTYKGVVIFTRLVSLPNKLFATDTLKYWVDKGGTVSYTNDFFENFDYGSVMLDTADLLDRIIFVDNETGASSPLRNGGQWIVGKGIYKVRSFATVCGNSNILKDSIYIVVQETPCLRVEIKNLPAYCKNDIIDITPYVYIDGQSATESQLSQTIFKDKGAMVVLPNDQGTAINPKAINIQSLLDPPYKYPTIELAYQPNVDFGICKNYIYKLTPKLPGRFIVTMDTVMVRNNEGNISKFIIDGEYYGFNNAFDSEIFSKLYLEPYELLNETSFKVFKEKTYKNEVTGTQLSPGKYYMIALNQNCGNDTSKFEITIKNRDFKIQYFSASNQGKGYHTFTAPEYPGALYKWIAWNGDIISGLNTREITVYYSENRADAVFVKCEIVLPNLRTSAGEETLVSAFYLEEENPVLGTKSSNDNKFTPNIFPNPADGMFTISGTGIYDMKIYNTLGMLEYQDTDYLAGTSLIIDKKGMHIIQLTQDGTTQTLKVFFK